MTDKSAEKLRACPFCGGVSYISHEPDYDGFGRFLFVECRKCRSRSGGQFVSNGNECSQTYQEVRDGWNTRADSGEAVAYCEIDNPINALAFAWPGGDRMPQHDTALYLQPHATAAAVREVERLDWLDAQVKEGTRIEFAKGLFGNSVEIGLRWPPRAFVQDTVRDCIDAAIAAERGEVGK